MSGRLAAIRYSFILLVLAAPSPFGTAAEPRELPTAELEGIWEDLAQSDEAGAQRAFDHVRTLARFPDQVIKFLRPRLRPVAAPDLKHVQQLIADLGSPVFARRGAASAELEGMGPLAGPALRKELGRSPPLEVARRMRDLLERIDRLSLSSDEVRALRAVEALELIGSPEARGIFEKLAKGAEGAELTCRARASLDRLAK